MKRKNIFWVGIMLVLILLAVCSCGIKKNKTGLADSKKDEKEQTVSTTVTTTEPPTKLSKNDKLIAMTFDDGPYSKTTNRILDTLKSNGGVATFFVVGYNINDNLDTIKRAMDMGCEIGNHTKDHKTITKLGSDSLRTQIDAPNEMIKENFGKAPVLFRAPGGSFKNVSDKVGMPLIQWSIDTEDWKHKDASNKGRSAEQRSRELNEIAQMVFDNAEKGDIILMHDIYDFTADLCEIVIPGLVQRGFKLVTVSEMYEAYGEKLENGKVYYNCDVKANEPAEAVVSGSYEVKTSGSVLNMRKSPDINSDVITKIPNGSAVEVVKAEPGWAYVRYNSYEGWVNSAYLKSAQYS